MRNKKQTIINIVYKNRTIKKLLSMVGLFYTQVQRLDLLFFFYS